MICWFRERLHHRSISDALREYILLSIEGLLTASPLLGELGAPLISTSHDVSPRRFVIFCYVVNTFGAFAIL